MNLTAIQRELLAPAAAPAIQPVAPAAPTSAPEALLKGVAVPAAVQQEAPAPQALEKAAARMEDYARSVGRSLQFRVDEGSGQVVVSVRDLTTGELIRQIPSEAALHIAQELAAGRADGASLIIEGQA